MACVLVISVLNPDGITFENLTWNEKSKLKSSYKEHWKAVAAETIEQVHSYME